MEIRHLVERFSQGRENQGKAVFSTIFIAGNRLQTIFDSNIPQLSLKQFMLLSVARQAKEPMNFSRLGKILGCSRQNIKKLAQILEKKGCVKLRASPADPRAMGLTLTDRGEEYFKNDFLPYQRELEYLFQVYSDEERAAHQQRIQGIEDEIAALEQQRTVARQSWDFLRYAQLTKQIKELKNALEKEQNNGDMFEIYELQKQNLREQQELIKQQIQAEKDKKDTDNNKIAEWEEAIKDIDTQIEDLERDMLETLAGTDVQTAIDDFADALVDAYCQGEDAAKALGEVTKETLKNAVVEALKRQFLAKAINDAVLYLGEAMQDGVLSDYEKKRFEEMVKEGADKFNMALEGVGDWIKDQTEEEEESDPLTGAVTSMSEETGGVIAGRLNAFVINQSDQIAIMKQNIIYQAQIAQNTKVSADELTEIKETLKRIENKDNSLLSQGIS